MSDVSDTFRDLIIQLRDELLNYVKDDHRLRPVISDLNSAISKLSKIHQEDRKL